MKLRLRFEVFLGYIGILVMFYVIYRIYPYVYKSSEIVVAGDAGRSPMASGTYDMTSMFFCAVMISATSLVGTFFCWDKFPAYRNSFAIVFLIAAIAIIRIAVIS